MRSVQCAVYGASVFCSSGGAALVTLHGSGCAGTVLGIDAPKGSSRRSCGHTAFGGHRGYSRPDAVRVSARIGAYSARVKSASRQLTAASRGGWVQGFIYLASPETAAATALAGEIAGLWGFKYL